MGKICVDCEDPSWTGQDPIKAPELPADGGGVILVDELPETGQKDMAYVLVDNLETPTKSSGIFVYQNGWVQAGAEQTVQIVDELPETGEEGIVYWLKKSGEDAYDLYEWRNDDWLKIDTDIKLYSTTGQNVDGSMTQKATTDAIYAAEGLARVLTADDYNWPTSNPDGVALWLLDSGVYDAGQQVKIYVSNGNPFTYRTIFISKASNGISEIILWQKASGTGGTLVSGYATDNAGRLLSSNGLMIMSSMVVDNLTSTITFRPLSAKQGKVLNEKIGGDLSNLTTTDKSSLINAINELNTNLGTVNTALQTLLNGTGA